MSLFETIQSDVQAAMKEKNQVKLTTLRSILAVFKNAKVAGTGEPTEEQYMDLITKQAKQRKESIAQFEGAGRDDLAAKEKEELAIIETYLPTQLSIDEVRTAALKKKDDMGITDKSGMGKLMGALMADLKGQVDGTVVKQVVEEILS